MRTVHQLASASLAGVFAVTLFVASHAFAEYRAAKQPAFHEIQLKQRIP
jgi:hypothetical protein